MHSLKRVYLNLFSIFSHRYFRLEIPSSFAISPWRHNLHRMTAGNWSSYSTLQIMLEFVECLCRWPKSTKSTSYTSAMPAQARLPRNIGRSAGWVMEADRRTAGFGIFIRYSSLAFRWHSYIAAHSQFSYSLYLYECVCMHVCVLFSFTGGGTASAASALLLPGGVDAATVAANCREPLKVALICEIAYFWFTIFRFRIYLSSATAAYHVNYYMQLFVIVVGGVTAVLDFSTYARSVALFVVYKINKFKFHLLLYALALMLS